MIDEILKQLHLVQMSFMGGCSYAGACITILDQNLICRLHTTPHVATSVCKWQWKQVTMVDS